MNTWLYVHAEDAEAPGEVTIVVEALERDSQALRATQGPDGGLKRPMLRQAVAESLGGLGCAHGSKSRFASEELDFLLADQRLAISVQAGRAWTNNGALLALLAAAADPEVDWLAVMVPFSYKTGTQYSRVARQMTDLVAAHGVDLDLAGVALIAY